MNKNIVYLLGAGASANASNLVDVNNKFPTNSNFRDIFSQFGTDINHLSKLYFNVTLSGGDYKYGKGDEQRRKIIEDIAIIDLEIKKHSSPDTIARKYYLKGKYKELAVLKNVLNLFFKYLHYKYKLDERYDAFFSMVFERDIHGNIVLPDNYKILTWNYDIMMDLSLSGFYDFENISQLNGEINMFPGKNSNKTFNNSFSIYKLNGSSNGKFESENIFKKNFYTRNIGLYDYDRNQNNDNFLKFIRTIIREYLEESVLIYSSEENQKDFNQGIRYAWEQEHENLSALRTKTYKSINNTDVLVIIGYSFPYFNRSIDKQLIDSMENLSRIYIQDTAQSIDIMVNKFIEIWPAFKNLVKPIVNDKEFYIPYH